MYNDLWFYLHMYLFVYVAFRDGVLIGPVVSDFILKLLNLQQNA